MNYIKSILFYLLVLSISINTYSQESKKEKKSKAKKERKSKAKKEKAPKAKKVKIPKEKTVKATVKKEDGVDKNFGPVFDGASVSLSAGVNVYFGDLADYKLFPKFGDIGKYSTSAFKFSIARDIKWGLGAKLNYQSGKLEGTRKTGKNSTLKSFENSFHDISIQPRYDLSGILFKQTEYTRFKVYAHLGLGLMWYRTKLFDTNTLNTKDYEGYIELENTEGIAQKVLSDKTSKAKTLTIPYGINVVYQLNHKIDIHFEFTQSSTTTDRLDAFDRDWTAKDKYDYIGLGLTYNFNRNLDDAPKKKDKVKKFDLESNENRIDSSLVGSNVIETKSQNKKSEKRGLFGKKNKKNSKEDELLNVRLKLFETQLKLFEMQYLLGK